LNRIPEVERKVNSLGAASRQRGFISLVTMMGVPGEGARALKALMPPDAGEQDGTGRQFRVLSGKLPQNAFIVTIPAALHGGRRRVLWWREMCGNGG
jgi:hypothetical protein